jgi:formylglycine-generating enzyme required for sulfatase activity
MLRLHRAVFNFLAASLAICIALSAGLACRAAITINTVPIGSPGNANDPADGDDSTSGIQNFGAVPYNYRIGKYDVTVGQYTAFLNAVAATDTYSLYNANMAADPNIAGVAQSCIATGCSYSVIGSANHPITYVNWGDAARFANWLHNGQPTGAEGPSTTETGAYTLNGATSSAALNAVSRNAGAQWFIPSENEWYKAAYYDPVAGNYWKYATCTDTTPISTFPDNRPNTANFQSTSHGFAVTGSQTYDAHQNYLTDVGAYTGSPSPFGTFDQSGLVFQWNEALTGSSRDGRGGSWVTGTLFLAASVRSDLDPTSEYGGRGFRVATVVNPAAGDYNQNGFVDAADYTLWRDTLGSTTNLAADGNGNHIIDSADYDIWKTNFGQHSPGADAAVPEPSTAALAVVTCGAMLKWRRRCVSPSRR